MRPRLAFLARLLRRPRLLAWLLGGLALLGVGGYLGARQLSAWRHLKAAETALDHYHPDEARAHLRACLEAWPHDARTRLLAARAARQAGDLKEAFDHLRAYGDLPDRDEQVRDLELRLLRAASGDVDPVEEDLQSRVEKGDPQTPLILEALLTGYLRTYRHREALLCVRLWFERQPDSAQVHFFHGLVAKRVHEYGQAAEDFARVVEADPGRDDARLHLVQCLLETGKHARALEHLEVLRGRRPDDPEVLSRMAFVQSDLGHAAEAARILDAVLAAHPDYMPALRGRGELALKSGRPAEAEGWLRRAAAANPYDRQVSLSLEQCLARQGKRAEARALADRRRRLEVDLLRVNEIATRLMPARPRDAGLRCELGTILLRIGRADVGERWLLSALALDPSCVEAHRALAGYYRGRGDGERAELHQQLAQAPPGSGER